MIIFEIGQTNPSRYIRVDQRLVAQLESPAPLHQIRHAAHRFRAARDDDLRAAGQNFLPPKHHRAQSRCARHVHRKRRHVVAQSRAPRDLPRRIRTHAGRPRIPENHLVDMPRRTACFRVGSRFASDRHRRASNSPGVRSAGSGEPNARSSAARTAIVPKIGLRELREHSAEFSDRRPHRAHDVNRFGHVYRMLAQPPAVHRRGPIERVESRHSAWFWHPGTASFTAGTIP